MNVIEILMRRDGVSGDEAQKTLDAALDAVVQALAGDPHADAEAVWERELGLEPDYLIGYMDEIGVRLSKAKQKERHESPVCEILPPTPEVKPWFDKDGKRHKGKPAVLCRTYVNRTAGDRSPIFANDFSRIRVSGWRADEKVVGWEVVGAPWMMKGGDVVPGNGFIPIAVITNHSRKLLPFVGRNTNFLNYCLPYMLEDIEIVEREAKRIMLEQAGGTP